MARIAFAFVGIVGSNKRCIPNEMRNYRSLPVSLRYLKSTKIWYQFAATWQRKKK